jgi:type II secretory pathway component PulF
MRIESFIKIDEPTFVAGQIIAAAVLGGLIWWLSRRSLAAAFIAVFLFPLLLGFLTAAYCAYRPQYMAPMTGMVLSILLGLAGLFYLASIPCDWKGEKVPWPKIWASGLLRILFVLVLLASLLALFNVMGLILFILLTAAFYQGLQAARRHRSFEIISSLTLCIQQNLPLPMALQTAARSYSGAVRAALERISYWLTQGYSLAQALRKGWPQVPPDLAASVENAEQIGRLPEILEKLKTDWTEYIEAKKIQRINLMYPALVLLVSVLMFLTAAFFILPRYEPVLQNVLERREDWPMLSAMLFSLTSYLRSKDSWVFWLIVLLPPLLFLLISSVYRLRRRPFPLKDRLLWHTPVIGRLRRHDCLLRLVRHLQAALKSGLDLTDAMEKSLSLPFNHCFRSQLVRCIQRMRSGQVPEKAAAEAGLDAKLVWAFSPANQTCLPAVLAMLEETTLLTLLYRRRLITVLFPFLILGLAGLIGSFVFAIFLPVVSAVTALTAEAVLP